MIGLRCFRRSCASWPAFSRLRAMGPPMLPKPTKPKLACRTPCLASTPLKRHMARESQEKATKRAEICGSPWLFEPSTQSRPSQMPPKGRFLGTYKKQGFALF